MAGDWLKMECSTPDKPEVLALTVRLGWEDPDLTVGKLFRLWRWFDQQTQNGNAENVTPALLDRQVGVTGFIAAVAEVGWLEIHQTGIRLTKFDSHNGNTAKNRAETARRVAKHKAKAATGDVAAPALCRASIPRPIRKLIMDRYACTCVYCGRHEGEYAPPEVSGDAVMHIDHVIPLSRGGVDSESNMVAACAVCNMFKSDRTPDEAGMVWPLMDGKRIGNGNSVTPPLPREEKRRKEKVPKGTTAIAAPAGVLDQTWADFLVIRKAKGAPITDTAMDGIQREAALANMTLQEALTECCARGWQGFKAAWIHRDNQTGGSSPTRNKQTDLEERSRKVAEDWANQGEPDEQP